MASYNLFFLPQEQAEGLSRYKVSLNVMVPNGILLWEEICAMDLNMLIRAKSTTILHSAEKRLKCDK